MEILNQMGSWISSHFGLTGFLIFGGIGALKIWQKSHRAHMAKMILAKSIETKTNEPLTLHPEINPSLCAGCGSCTAACPEGDILQLVDHKAVLVEPTHCVGHGECEAACPTSAITLVFGTKTRGMDIPRITTDYETNVPGLYIAGELGGMGLIRNAIKQGHMAAKHALTHSKTKLNESVDTELLVIGAGPAGLAAALTAIAEKKDYLCIDQNTFGGTVNNFPRQKVVMTHPADLPIVGKMRFKKDKVSKEELLEFWESVRTKTGLKVKDKTRFDHLEKVGEVFHVKTSTGLMKARKVILCMGVRGNPRRLGLPNEDLPKVAYNLIDPAQYEKKKIAIVGAGNAAVEAACALADKGLGNEIILLVRGTVMDRCNQDNKDAIEALAAQGTLQIWYEASVKEIQPDCLEIQSAGSQKKISNDFLFVFAGADMPHKFLMSLGIKIEKKFGEAPEKSA